MSLRWGRILVVGFVVALVAAAAAMGKGGELGSLKLSGYWSGKLAVPKLVNHGASLYPSAGCEHATGFSTTNGKAAVAIGWPQVKIKVGGKTTTIRRLVMELALPKFGGTQTLVAPTAPGAGSTHATLKFTWGVNTANHVNRSGAWDTSGTVTTDASGKAGSVDATVEVYSNLSQATGPKGQFTIKGSWKGCRRAPSDASI